MSWEDVGTRASAASSWECGAGALSLPAKSAARHGYPPRRQSRGHADKAGAASTPPPPPLRLRPPYHPTTAGSLSGAFLPPRPRGRSRTPAGAGAFHRLGHLRVEAMTA